MEQFFFFFFFWGGGGVYEIEEYPIGLKHVDRKNMTAPRLLACQHFAPHVPASLALGVLEVGMSGLRLKAVRASG